MMNHLFNRKRKNSPEPFPQVVSPGTLLNAAAGPVNHQAESTAGPGGGESRSYQDPDVC